jgi:hypothetical protein
VHAACDEKSDDSNDYLYKKLEQAFFYNFSKFVYEMVTLLGDFNA